jgi:HTH-type transcriptional regulator/antitoxin HipB
MVDERRQDIPVDGCRQVNMQINSIQDLASAVRGRRQELALSQGELATRARVSRDWINQIEAGKPKAEIGLIIRLLDALDLRLDLVPRGSGGDVSTDLDSLLEEYGRDR